MGEDGDSTSVQLVPYERGLPLSTALRGTFGRFLPGTVLSLAAVFTFLGGGGPGVWPEAIVLVGGTGLALSLGFGAGLEALRRWLYPDARVDGRRSFVAGLMAPLLFFILGIVSSPISGQFQILGLLFLAAMVMALLMFFAWLTPTPEEMRGPEFETNQDRPGKLTD